MHECVAWLFMMVHVIRADAIQEVVCELKKCPDDESKNSVTMRMPNGANHIYELKQVQEGESLGYIPLLFYCVDKG